MRIKSSNEVRTEKMNLETAKTATYNKFTKTSIEEEKRIIEDREKR